MDFELVPMLVVASALPAPELLEHEGLVEVGQEVGAIVVQLELDYAVDVAELGQSFVVGLVEVAVIPDTAEETLDYFVEQVSDAEVVD